MGRLATVDVDGETRYVTDSMREYLDHIRDLVVEHTKADLRDELEAIAEEVEAWKAEYGADSTEALDASLGAADLAPEELRERRKVASTGRKTRSIGSASPMRSNSTTT